MPYLSCILPSPKCFPFLNFVPALLSRYPNPAWYVFVSCQVTALKHSLGPVVDSCHPPSWAQLPHQRQPCLLIYTTLILSPALQLGDFPLISHVSLSGGHVSPSPESSLLLSPVSCLFHHKGVWSCPLFLSCLGACPLLPSSQQPALLCLSLGSQQSFPAFPWLWLEPLGLSPGICLPSHHVPLVLVPCLSLSLSSSLIPTVNRDSPLAGPGTMCEWAEGRHPQTARRFQPERDEISLRVTQVSFSLAVKVWGQPEKRFEWESHCCTFGKVHIWSLDQRRVERAQPTHMAPQVLSASRSWLQSHLAGGSEMFWQLLWYVLLPARTGSRRVEITEESKPVHLVFLAEAGSGVPEINCVSSIIEEILL